MSRVNRVHLASLTDNLASVHISSPVHVSVRQSLSDIAENAAVTPVDLPVSPASSFIIVDVVTATLTMSEEESRIYGESSSSPSVNITRTAMQRARHQIHDSCYIGPTTT